jgi:2-polyprenyl-3-methyl-5-hydroxy-6-metoxy-1,4-benzoquinol methylase
MHITPVAVECAREWDQLVLSEHTQTDRFRDPPPDEDPWTGLAWNFAPPDKAEADLDPAVPVIDTYLDKNDTVIDVGAGGGRLAIPLARRCARVIAVEPSNAMRAGMEASISELGVDNVDVVAETWEDADIPVGDQRRLFARDVRHYADPAVPGEAA